MARARSLGRSGNLPADVNSFVGRGQEVADIRRLLGATRLITLLGTGGVGKTRLALRAASKLSGIFADGAWLVQLGALTDPDLLAYTVAVSLSLPSRQAGWTPEALAAQLEDEERLLILDGCEQLSQPVARLFDMVLRRCQHLKILATSRQTLDLDGEARYPVPPLRLPPLEGLGTVADTLDFPAVRLFVDRARTVVPDFSLDRSNVNPVVTLCHRLDGIPLALELAAGRMAVLGVEDLLELHDNELLSTRNPLAPDRQQTLDATIRWSYDLLTAAERRLWRQLCVFSGGFGLDAVYFLAPTQGCNRQRVVELLEGLVDKSMIQRRADANQTRFVILETLRGFGLRELSACGQLTAVRRIHRDCVSMMLTHSSQPVGQAAWINRIAVEVANLRTALDFCEESGDARAGLEICTAVWVYWRVRGPIDEARRQLARFLAFPKDDSALFAKGLWVAGAFALMQNDYEAASRLLASSLRQGRKLSDAPTIGWATYYLSLAAYFQADLDGAARLVASARISHDAQGDRFGLGLAFSLSGQIELARGNFASAAEFLGEALRLIREIQNTWIEAYVLWLIGLVKGKQNDRVGADRMFKEALLLNQETHDQTGVALCLEGMAWLAADLEQPVRASQLLGAARRAWAAKSAEIAGPLRALHETCLALVTSQLGPERFAELEQSGFELARADVVRLALDQPSVPVRVGQSPELTHREQELADLVADGLSNREIAARLVLSKRTVDSHVDHIFAKLGFKSRVSLATWVRAQPKQS